MELPRIFHQRKTSNPNSQLSNHLTPTNNRVKISNIKQHFKLNVTAISCKQNALSISRTNDKMFVSQTSALSPTSQLIHHQRMLSKKSEDLLERDSPTFKMPSKIISKNIMKGWSRNLSPMLELVNNNNTPQNEMMTPNKTEFNWKASSLISSQLEYQSKESPTYQ